MSDYESNYSDWEYQSGDDDIYDYEAEVVAAPKIESPVLSDDESEPDYEYSDSDNEDPEAESVPDEEKPIDIVSEIAPDELVMEEPVELEDVTTASPDVKNIEEVIVVKPENRMSRDYLSSYELTRLINVRASMIAKYNNCLVDTTGMDDPIKMAEKEIRMGKCPLKVRRVTGMPIDKATKRQVKYVEIWHLSELNIPKI